MATKEIGENISKYLTIELYIERLIVELSFFLFHQNVHNSQPEWPIQVFLPFFYRYDVQAL